MLAIEGEDFGRLSRNCGVSITQRCLGFSDGERGGPHFIGKNNASDVSGKRGMHDLLNDEIAASQRSLAVVNSHRRCSPCAHPVRIACCLCLSLVWA